MIVDARRPGVERSKAQRISRLRLLKVRRRLFAGHAADSATRRFVHRSLAVIVSLAVSLSLAFTMSFAFTMSLAVTMSLAFTMSLAACRVSVAAEAGASPVGSEPALRAALLTRMDVDQALRMDFIAAGLERPDRTRWHRIAVVNAGNTAWLHGVIARHGWPGRSLVGTDGASAAFVPVQHADADPAFQRRCLALIERMPAGEVDGEARALLTDRTLIAEGRKQRFGSQLDGTCAAGYAPKPVEDEARVDARRAALDLPPLAAYLDTANRLFCPNAQTP